MKNIWIFIIIYFLIGGISFSFLGDAINEIHPDDESFEILTSSDNSITAVDGEVLYLYLLGEGEDESSVLSDTLAIAVKSNGSKLEITDSAGTYHPTLNGKTFKGVSLGKVVAPNNGELIIEARWEDLGPNFLSVARSAHRNTVYYFLGLFVMDTLLAIAVTYGLIKWNASRAKGRPGS